MKRIAVAIISFILVACPLGAQQGFIWDVNYAVRDWSQSLSGGREFPLDNYLQFASYLGYVAAIPFADSEHSWHEKTLVAGTSFTVMMALVYSTKWITGVSRPNSTNHMSFPSGHTAMAFAGAEIVRQEYGPWWGLAAYSAAAATGFLRIYNNWHWFTDVVAGAGVGILSGMIAYWLLPWERDVFKLEKANVTASPSLAQVPVAVPVMSVRFSW